MAKKYIDADKLLESGLRFRGGTNDDGLLYVPFCDVLKSIKEMPTADVEEVRHGRWIEDGDVQICSECGEEHEWADYRAPYCDICGAKMDGKEKTE